MNLFFTVKDWILGRIDKELHMGSADNRKYSYTLFVGFATNEIAKTFQEI